MNLQIRYVEFANSSFCKFLVTTRYGIEEDKVSTFSWNIIDPPVVIFCLIEDLEIIAEAANNQKSDTQLVNYGLDLVRNTSEFETALLAWRHNQSFENCIERRS